MRNQVGCLNLLTNAVIVWNTVYTQKVVQRLQQEGIVVNESELKHIWPTRFGHINIYGTYHFNPETIGKKELLRSLNIKRVSALATKTGLLLNKGGSVSEIYARQWGIIKLGNIKPR